MGSRLRDTVRYLFELFCEVSHSDSSKQPQIIWKYPETYKNEEELKNIPKFTFPCPLESSFVQHYSFVLTSVDSKYTFCFCRFDPRSNSSLVLLSHLPWHDIFYKLLNCISNLLNTSEKKELISFLDACHMRPPMPGHTLKVTYNAGHSLFSCPCPDARLPSIPDNFNLTEYFSAVDTKCMAGLWAALLHERRVAIIATKISRLSACVQAANATLFPMSWQHIFIPILPKHLVDYLLAPMPFLIGVPRNVMESVRLADIGEVVILDVDANILISPFNDLEGLPSDLVFNLMKDLSDKNVLGDAVSRAFLRALVCLIGGYRDAIRIEKGQLITFNPEAFIRTRKNMQSFLQKILQSQIFQQFIEERLELLNSGRGFNDEFEMECNLHVEVHSMGSGHKLKQQYKDWAKTFKKEGGAFFRNVKDKANPAMQSAVNSVKQGGKNVKSVVRVLKNKLPKNRSRPNSVSATDDNRCGSVTPVSSESSDSSPVRDMNNAANLPVDLLSEMEILFAKEDSSSESKPITSNCRVADGLDDSMTFSPSIPPRLPDRPSMSTRYPIVPTRRLVDFTDAPLPPPRLNHNQGSSTQFVSNITKNNTGNTDFHTSTIRFDEVGNDKAKLKLTLSNQRKSLPTVPQVPPPPLLIHKKITAKENQKSPHMSFIEKDLYLSPPPKERNVVINSTNSRETVSDLIKLDDTPPEIEEFDPLKCKNTPKTSADSALLHEYGLDFSNFGLLDFDSGAVNNRSELNVKTPKEWTKFN